MAGEVFCAFDAAARGWADRSRAAADAALGDLPHDMTRILPGAGSIRQGIEFDGIGRPRGLPLLRRHPGDMTDPGLAGKRCYGAVPPRGDPHPRPGRGGAVAGRVALCRGRGEAVHPRSLRRRGTGAEEDRGDVRDVHYLPCRKPPSIRPRMIWRWSRAGGAARFRRGCHDSVDTIWVHLRAFPVPHAAADRAALGVPYGYLTGDTAKGNFSNTRIALVDFRRRISAFSIQ